MPEIKIIKKGSLEHRLIECCGKGSLLDVRALLDAGADVNAKMPDEFGDWEEWCGGYFVAHAAAENPDIRIIKLLVERGADVNVGDFYGSTPLYYAARKNTLDMIKYLVSLGNDPLEENCDGDNLLTFSACNPHKDVLEYFLQQGVDIDGVSDIVPLGVAMLYGTPVDMDFFIENGANKEFALACALNCASLENIRHLLEKGCDVNAVYGFEDDRYDLTKLPDGPLRRLFLEYGAKSDEELNAEGNA